MKGNGFTLLELLIALMIFSLISGAAYRMFVVVSDNHQVTGETLKHLDRWQRFRVLLEKDLSQISLRPVRDEEGMLEPALVSRPDNRDKIKFTRDGWNNPLGQARSTLQRITYQLEDDQLIRYFWSSLDRPPVMPGVDHKPYRQPVLGQVKGALWRFMDHHGLWHTQWPPDDMDSNSQAYLASAIELQIQHEHYGSLSIIVPTPTGSVPRLKGGSG